MKVSDSVHQIKIEFEVTETVKRYVYLYLIVGKKCYLIDAGVAGCKKTIEAYLKNLGRDLSDIDAIFLTHAHPDHIGGASEIFEATGCKIYISETERKWVEDIDTQFQERPIPNFYKLVNKSVFVHETVKDDNIFSLESGMTLRVIASTGHSSGSVSYIWEETGILFSGDAIPNLSDLPILVDMESSIKTLERLCKEDTVNLCCPAWDRLYAGAEIADQLHRSESFLEKLKTSVQKAEKAYGDNMETEKLSAICKNMGFDPVMINPLFKQSVNACK
ncbi:MAG: MBL fold metallo-hydrolase [Brotaphodocola sp.]